MVTHTQTEKGLLQETTCSIDFKPWSRNVQNKCSQVIRQTMRINAFRSPALQTLSGLTFMIPLGCILRETRVPDKIENHCGDPFGTGRQDESRHILFSATIPTIPA